VCRLLSPAARSRQSPHRSPLRTLRREPPPPGACPPRRPLPNVAPPPSATAHAATAWGRGGASPPSVPPELCSGCAPWRRRSGREITGRGVAVQRVRVSLRWPRERVDETAGGLHSFPSSRHKSCPCGVSANHHLKAYQNKILPRLFREIPII
jgi:hypothetical protein